MNYSETIEMMKRALGRIRQHADWQEPERAAYADPSASAVPYPSVYCMPHVRETLNEILAIAPLAFAFNKTRTSLPRLAEQSLQCLEALDAVDKFYDIFQDEQWVFHESIPTATVQSILSEVETGKISVREASNNIADIYDDGFLRCNITRLYSVNYPTQRNNDGPFCIRGKLLNEARELYSEERYSACVHLLLACADGAVNDFNDIGENKKGLWARAWDGTVTAYDAFVGHEHGLTSVLKTAAKKTTKLPIMTLEELKSTISDGYGVGNIYKGMLPERYLYRHGIEHGMLVNYDNKLVAAKAWNLIFAVGDWMNSVLKAKIPAEPDKSFADSVKDALTAVASNQEYKEKSEAHVNISLTPNSKDFDNHPLKKRAEHFLACWKGKNGNVQCREMWQFGTERTLPFWWKYGNDLCVKEHFEFHRISSFRIDEINHYSYEYADVHITCQFKGYIRSEEVNKDIKMTLKWTLTDEQDNLPFVSDNPEWYLMTWDPWLAVEL